MARQWRCGVVGTGMVGEWHVRVIPTVAGATLGAVCDVVPDRARAALEKNKRSGVAVYDNLGDMLKREALDVIHIATPSGDHMGPALAAIAAGKYVICEKPMEIAVERIDEMAAAAAARGVKLAGIFQNRWSDANRAVKEAAAQGRFGTLTWAGSFTPWYRPDKYYEDVDWRGTWKLDGGGAIMNQSVHSIDLLQWIAGDVRCVSAYASSRIHAKIEVEDTLSCSLEFKNGAFGTMLGTTAMFPGMPPRIEIGGSDGTAVSENGLRVFKFRNELPTDLALVARLAPPPTEGVAARIKESAGPEAYERMFAAQGKGASGGGASAGDVSLALHGRNIDAILRAWEAGREAETCPAEARKAVAIILAMYESVRGKGKPVLVG